jgi:ketosteroid isomerase-like protein
MSQQNVETTRRLFGLFNEGDDAVWDQLPPEHVFDFSRRQLNPVVVRGRDQVRAFWEGEGQFWEGGHLGFQPKELIDAGDKVLAFLRISGRGKTSGVEVETHVWSVMTFRDGEAVETTYFGDDRAAALEAAGLSEQEAHAQETL